MATYSCYKCGGSGEGWTDLTTESAAWAAASAANGASKMTFTLTFRRAPTEALETVTKRGFDEAWAFANNNARYNKLFHLISIADVNGVVVYRG